MRVLLTGGSGFIGGKLAERLSKKHEVTLGLRNISAKLPFKKLRLDLTDGDSIRDALFEASPDVVIHAAALTSAEECAKNRELCHKVNVEATAELAANCLAIGATMAYISTDLIFDGRKGNYSEQDKPNPPNVYAASKLEGEQALLSVMPYGLIIRSAIVYGIPITKPAEGFLAWLLQELSSKRQVNLFTDQLRSHLYIDDCTKGIEMLVEKELSGIYHLSSGSKESRYDFGKVVADIFQLDGSLINSCKMSDMKGMEKRGNDCSLNSEKLMADTDFSPTGMVEALTQLKKEYDIRREQADS